MSTFRSEVFDACKKLQKNEKIEKIQELLNKLNTISDNQNTKSITNKMNGDFAMVARQFGSQFHGYLFVDDNVESINSQPPFAVEKLSNEDRKLFEICHGTIMAVVKKCLEEITLKSPNIGNVMNPYSLLKEVEYDTNSEMLLSDEDIEKIATSFRGSEVYKSFYNSNILKEVEKNDVNNLRMIVGSLEKSISKDYFDPTNSNIEVLWKNISDGSIGNGGRVFGTIIILYALRFSLSVACQLLYEAICGMRLIIIDNNNLINIETNQSNCIGEFYKVLVQGGFSTSASGGIGEVALLDCELSNDRKIHEFGFILQSTISFNREMGDTSKYSITVLNDELINISQIVESILSSEMLNK
ncbi:MAG: hypothetical protein IJF94_04840 [Eubacterium sp.]|nr:hypothetical protein [Eubacterium sp.]